MRFCLLGSEPTSLPLAPFSDPNALIWACSPGVYPALPRCDEFFELHRFEPGVIGKPQTQKPWFSPEYVAWIGQQKVVWVAPKALEQWRQYWPRAQAYPIDDMTAQFGNQFWTSSLAYMAAMAINQIMVAGGDNSDHSLEFYGVDMAADSEVYSQQRAGCHYFIGLAHLLGIKIFIPPESDLLRPTGRYGIDESEDWHIKGLARTEKLRNDAAAHEAQAKNHDLQAAYLKGALSDHEYHMRTWMTDRPMVITAPELFALSPRVRGICREGFDIEAAAGKVVPAENTPPVVTSSALTVTHAPSMVAAKHRRAPPKKAAKRK